MRPDQWPAFVNSNPDMANATRMARPDYYNNRFFTRVRQSEADPLAYAARDVLERHLDNSEAATGVAPAGSRSSFTDALNDVADQLAKRRPAPATPDTTGAVSAPAPEPPAAPAPVTPPTSPPTPPPSPPPTPTPPPTPSPPTKTPASTAPAAHARTTFQHPVAINRGQWGPATGIYPGWKQGNLPVDENSRRAANVADYVTGGVPGLYTSGGMFPSDLPGRSLAGVTPVLREMLGGAKTAFERANPGYQVIATSGARPGGPSSSQHAGGNAIDMQIIGPNGAVPNTGNDPSGLYHQYARYVYAQQQATHPELNGRLAWGGAFGTQLGGGGPPDLMHFDLGGERGHWVMNRPSRLGAMPIASGEHGADVGAGGFPINRGQYGPTTGTYPGSSPWNTGPARTAATSMPSAVANSYLAQQRAPIFDEIARNPGLRTWLASIADHELSGNPLPVLESLFNRAEQSHKSLERLTSEGEGFYGPATAKGGYKVQNAINAGLPQNVIDATNAALAQIRAGSNVTRGATDQGMINEIKSPWKINVGGEYFGDMDNGIFRARQQAAAARAARMAGMQAGGAAEAPAADEDTPMNQDTDDGTGAAPLNVADTYGMAQSTPWTPTRGATGVAGGPDGSYPPGGVAGGPDYRGAHDTFGYMQARPVVPVQDGDYGDRGRGRGGWDFSSGSKIWPAMVTAGAAMMASGSPYFGQALGEGLLAGAGAYSNASASERTYDMEQRKIDMEAQKIYQTQQNQQSEMGLKERIFQQTPRVMGHDRYGSPIYGLPDPRNPGVLKPITIDPETGQVGGAGTTPLPGGQGGIQMISDWQKLTPEEGQTRRTSLENVQPTDSGAGLSEDSITPLSRYLPQGVPTSQDADGRLHGDGYLQTIKDPNERELVRQIALGRIQSPTPNSRAGNSPYWRQVMEEVRQYDSSFNQQRYKTFSEFATGKDAANLASFNTAISHAADLNNTINDLQKQRFFGGAFGPVNAMQDWYGRNVGGDLQNNLLAFQAGKTALTEELTRAFRMAGGNVHDIEEWSKALDSANSPEGLHFAVKKMMDLLNGRVGAVAAKYNNAMVPPGGIVRRTEDFLSPSAEAAMKRLRAPSSGAAPAPAKPGEQPVTSGQPQNAPAGIPQEAIDQLKASPNTRRQFDAIFGKGAADKILGAP
jgi:hypothetical protein